MTFDELWRQDLALTQTPINAIDTTKDDDCFDDPATTDPLFELNRFLDLLEQSL